MVKPKIQLVKLIIQLVKPKIQLVKPKIQLVKPKIQLVKPKIQLEKPKIQLVKPKIQLVKPKIQLVKLIIQLVKPKIQLVKLKIQLVKPKIRQKCHQINLRTTNQSTDRQIFPPIEKTNRRTLIIMSNLIHNPHFIMFVTLIYNTKCNQLFTQFIAPIQTRIGVFAQLSNVNTRVSGYFMVTLRNFILASLGLFLLTQCNTKTDSNSGTQILSPPAKTQSENSLTGEWKYSESIWYSSELTLQDNGTFKFHDQGCYGQKFSQGQWTNNNGTIVLTSFDNFKQKEKTDTIKSTEVADEKKSRRKLKKGEVEYTFVGIKDVPPPVLPGPNDTVRIYLDKIKLRLSNDTLYCVGSDKLPEGAKFYRTKNNR